MDFSLSAKGRGSSQVMDFSLSTKGHSEVPEVHGQGHGLLLSAKGRSHRATEVLAGASNHAELEMAVCQFPSDSNLCDNQG